jgi:hypothetical protein
MHCTYEFNTLGVIHAKAICIVPGILFFKISKFLLSKKEDLTRNWKTGIIRAFIRFISIIIRLIESKRMRWKGHVKYMGNMADKYKILLEKRKGETTWVA